MTEWPEVPRAIAAQPPQPPQPAPPSSEFDAQIKSLWHGDLPIPVIAARLCLDVPTTRRHLQRLGLMTRRE